MAYYHNNLGWLQASSRDPSWLHAAPGGSIQTRSNQPRNQSRRKFCPIRQIPI
jgi:hypothetical protein